MAEPTKVIKWPYISILFARHYRLGKIKKIADVPERFRPGVIEVLLYWGVKREDIV